MCVCGRRHRDTSPHYSLAGGSLVPTQKSSDCFFLNRHLGFSLPHNQLLNFSNLLHVEGSTWSGLMGPAEHVVYSGMSHALFKSGQSNSKMAAKYGKFFIVSGTKRSYF